LGWGEEKPACQPRKNKEKRKKREPKPLGGRTRNLGPRKKTILKKKGGNYGVGSKKKTEGGIVAETESTSNGKKICEQ